MIDIKDWKKYREMMRILNVALSEKHDRYWKIAIKQRNIMQEEMSERAKKRGMMCRILPIPFSMFVGKQVTMEGCLNWVADGRPVFAKKLKVKNV